MARFSPIILLCVTSMLFSSSNSALAEHAKISLEIKSSTDQQTAFVDQTPPAVGKNPRPVFKAKAGEPLKIQWYFTNIYPNKTIENVVMHFYIARQGKVGQNELPALGEDVVIETAFEMDFKPGAKSGARSTIRIDQPGVYLVRVESVQTQSDHEHFSAIDLVIEPASR